MGKKSKNVKKPNIKPSNLTGKRLGLFGKNDYENSDKKVNK